MTEVLLGSGCGWYEEDGSFACREAVVSLLGHTDDKHGRVVSASLGTASMESDKWRGYDGTREVLREMTDEGVAISDTRSWGEGIETLKVAVVRAYRGNDIKFFHLGGASRDLTL